MIYQLSILGVSEDLVYLKEIKDNRIYFYTDIYKSTEKKLTLYEQMITQGYAVNIIAKGLPC